MWRSGNLMCNNRIHLSGCQSGDLPEWAGAAAEFKERRLRQ